MVTYIESDSNDSTFYFNDFRLVDVSGKEYAPVWSTMAGSGRISGTDYTTFHGMMYKGLPIKVEVGFNYTGNAAARLMFDSKVLNNIPVKGVQAVAPRPAATTTVSVSAGNVDIKLSGCKTTSTGGYSCTSATVTPR